MIVKIRNIEFFFKFFYKKRFIYYFKEHCYKYCPLGTCEECLVAKYHTHILHKQNLNIHYILQHCIGAPVPSLLVHLPHHLFYERHDMEGQSILSQTNILQSKIKSKSFGAKTPYFVNQLKRICESISRFICLYPNFQAILKSHLTAHITKILFEKLFIHLPLLFLNTPLPPALLGLYF